MFGTILFISGQEVIFAILIALLLFGSKEIPKLARTFARGMKEFRRATDDIKREFENSTPEVVEDFKEIRSSLTRGVNDIKSNLLKDTEVIKKNFTKEAEVIKEKLHHRSRSDQE